MSEDIQNAELLDSRVRGNDIKMVTRKDAFASAVKSQIKKINSRIDRFVRVPILGIDLDPENIRIVQLGGSKQGFVLRRVIIQKVIPGQDAALELKRIVENAHLDTRNAAVAIRSPEVIARPLQFPRMPARELRNALMLEAEQSILNGHLLNQVRYDWHLLNTLEDGRSQGLMAVVPEEVVEERIRTVRAAGLKPIVVDVEGLALWNAYWLLEGATQGNGRTVVLIRVGSDTTNFVAVRGSNELILLRDLHLGSSAIQAGKQNEWLSEVHDSFAYARSQGGLRDPDQVLVTGVEGSPAWLGSLESVAKTRVHVWNPLERLSIDPKANVIPAPDLSFPRKRESSPEQVVAETQQLGSRFRGSDIDELPRNDITMGPMLATAIGLALRNP